MTASTINRNIPPANTPVSSSGVRSNFDAAANDIDALWAAIEAIAPLVGVSSFNGRTGEVTLESSDITDALGYDPSYRMGNFFWANPVNSVLPIVVYSQYAFDIVRLNSLSVDSGTLTLTVAINGVAVTGMSAISVTTSPTNITASGLNSVSVSDQVTLTVASAVGASNLKFTMLGQL